MRINILWPLLLLERLQKIHFRVMALKHWTKSSMESWLHIGLKSAFPWSTPGDSDTGGSRSTHFRERRQWWRNKVEDDLGAEGQDTATYCTMRKKREPEPNQLREHFQGFFRGKLPSPLIKRKEIFMGGRGQPQPLVPRDPLCPCRCPTQHLCHTTAHWWQQWALPLTPSFRGGAEQGEPFIQTLRKGFWKIKKKDSYMRLNKLALKVSLSSVMGYIVQSLQTPPPQKLPACCCGTVGTPEVCWGRLHCVSSQLPVQKCLHVGSLNVAIVRLFTPQKSAKKQGVICWFWCAG